MGRTIFTAMVFAASATLGVAAYAQDAHDHGTPKSGADAAQGHDAHCCKPDPNDMKGMQGMAGHDHMQATTKTATKKPGRKPGEQAAKDKTPESR